MSYIKQLIVLQMGKENSWGTLVPATARVMDVESFKINPNYEHETYKNQGSLAPSYSVVQKFRAIQAAMEGRLSYEQIAYLLEGMFGVMSVTGEGPYTRSFNGPLTSLPTPRIFSFEYADGTANGVNYSMAGGILNKLTIKIEKGLPWTYSAEFLGKTVAGVVRANLSDIPTTLISANDTKIYMDSKAGTVGTTEIPAGISSLELTIEPQRSLVQYVGSVNPGAYSGKEFKFDLKMGLEFNTQSKALVSEILAGTVEKQMRIKAENGDNSIQIDAGVANTTAPELVSDNDGISTIDCTMVGIFNSTLGGWISGELVNSVEVLP